MKEISTTDAMLELASAATPYVLPPVVASVSAGKSQEFTGGSCGSTCASLTKTGPGELKFDAPVTVTGAVDVSEGRVTIRNRKAGLIFGQSGPVGNASSLYVGEHVYTNGVQSSTHLAYQDGDSVGHSNCVVWAGYLWNRAETNVNWTFAFAMNQGLVFRFDGVKKIEDYSFQQAQRSLKCTVAATPGPHYVQFRVYGSQSSGGGPTKARYIQNMTWKDAFGIAVDKLGRDSDDLNDYEKVEDPGDGSFITVSADDTLPDLPNWAPAITNLRLRPGAELDTMGGDLALAKLDGVGTVRNATVIENRVAVNGPWTAAATQITSDKGGAFAVEKGTLAFGAGATFELAFDKRLARNTLYPIAHADGGIEGLPQLTDAMKADYWELKLSDDGKTLYLNSVKGLSIFLR